MKYFSMFSGIGGFEEGIHRVCPEWKCIGMSQYDPTSKIQYPDIILKKHFPEVVNYGDATKIDADKLPDFDMLVGGFPCQAFSIAGRRKGFEDIRGTLFFDIARIIKTKRPKVVWLENVKGLLNHDKGNTFAKILETFWELGYDVEWQLLNSKNFGVPQNRERVFIVGYLRTGSRRKIFSERSTSEEFNERKTKIEVAASLQHPGHSGGNYKGMNMIKVGTLRTHNDGKGFRELKEGISPTIPARAREDGSGQPCIDDGYRIRRLTPTECERLQGFTDGWTEGLSDTQRYKTLGNAVTVNVIEYVAKLIEKYK